MLELHFADTRSSSPPESDRTNATPFRLTQLVVFAYTHFLWNSRYHFRRKRTSVPAGLQGLAQGEFFQYVRNAILHNGETRKDWKIRIDTERMLERDPITNTRTINRRHLHAAIEAEFRDLLVLVQ